MRLTEDEREQKDEQHLEVRRYNSGHSIRQAHIGLDIGGRFTEGICSLALAEAYWESRARCARSYSSRPPRKCAYPGQEEQERA